MKVIDSPSDLGYAVRSARKSLGLTQPELALAAGVGVRFIVDVEAGKATVQLNKVLRVIDVLGGRLAFFAHTDEPRFMRSGGNDG